MYVIVPMLLQRLTTPYDACTRDEWKWRLQVDPLLEGNETVEAEPNLTMMANLQVMKAVDPAFLKGCGFCGGELSRFLPKRWLEPLGPAKFKRYNAVAGEGVPKSILQCWSGLQVGCCGGLYPRHCLGIVVIMASGHTTFLYRHGHHRLAIKFLVVSGPRSFCTLAG